MTSCVIKPNQYSTSEGCRSSLRCSHSAYMARSLAGAGPSPRGWQSPQGRDRITREELSIMATDTGSTGASVSRPGDVGLRREMGLFGATWSSTTSIIGSGWLFAGLGAAAATGAAAIYGWIIGAGCVIILALVRAQLGAVFPVAGGTARFPHLAFGSVAGMSFGFFSWLQAVTVAPIEVFAVIQYGSYYWASTSDPTNQWSNIYAGGKVTDLGFVCALVLMALFTGINFL